MQKVQFNCILQRISEPLHIINIIIAKLLGLKIPTLTQCGEPKKIHQKGLKNIVQIF